MVKRQPRCPICGVRAGSVFCKLAGPQLTKLDKEKTVHEYQRGQVIFYEGNTPLGIYCIYSGRVKLYKTGRRGKQQVIRVLGPGDTMAYRALLSNEPCSSTAMAIEPTTICVISKQTLFNLLKQSQELAIQFLMKL